MNKYTYFFFISLVMLLSSCSSDVSDDAVDNNALVIGTYNLTEININVAQDVNEDGVSSNNMLDELECLSGTLVINVDNTWTLDLVDLDITNVTSDFYAIRCGRTNSFTGKWSFQGSSLNLNSTEFGDMALNNSVLTEGISENLPGVLNRKFTKQ
ncbi:hypothetical protein LCGC14_0067360 [marine sediment metagenome]|uniref:Lipocalin-like domain-containing protein n=1 Tax=marine sediment metagenome TaxID=412755 RepID=A0A0F9Y3E1_9ZZZZ|nr:hypothetical protein [Maribacter sp.]HDZ05560.1 hypothetical protein [Maribacter sp.]HEA81638.1 hypothetical protein [Maribacter sp.]